MNELTGGRTWLLGLLILPPILGFILLDAGVGLLLGMLTAASLVVIAVRTRPDVRIEVAAPGPGVAGGVLVVLLEAIEEPRVAGVLAAIGDPSRAESGEEGLRLLAPVKIGRIDLWASDVQRARFESQRVLAVSIAALAAAGIEARGRVGDGDIVQAVEDTVRTYAATEVAILTGAVDAEAEIATLERRLPVPLRRVG